MARVVLLSFKENDAAEQFIASVLAAQDESTPMAQMSQNIMAAGAIASACGVIEAMIARPTVACRCVIVGKSQRGTKSKFRALGERWVKSERFGWLIHERCKRPNYWVVKRFIDNMHVGYNDLLPELKAKLRPVEEIIIPESIVIDDSSKTTESEPLVFPS